MLLATLIFSDQRLREETLITHQAREKHARWGDGGRLILRVSSPTLEGTYFVGRDGVLHELVANNHVFPCGSILTGFAPKQ